MLSHAGSPHDRSAAGLAAWVGELKHLSRLSHVACKLSGLGMFEHNWTAASIRPIVETCPVQFGVGQEMFGSNFPVDKLYSGCRVLTQVYRGLVPAEMHSAMFRGTAARFYGLTDASRKGLP